MGFVESASDWVGKTVVPAGLKELLTSQTLTPAVTKASPIWNFGHGMAGSAGTLAPVMLLSPQLLSPAFGFNVGSVLKPSPRTKRFRIPTSSLTWLWSWPVFPLFGATRYTPRRLWKSVRPSTADMAGPKGMLPTGS